MPKRRVSRSAFTLLEVMVAVMIVSVVIAALLKMQGDASHKFMQIKEMINTSQYSSFLLSSSDKYGFQRSSTDMKTLLDDFELESDLRRKLSAMKLKIEYEELQTIDTSEFSEQENESYESYESNNLPKQSSSVVFEIGKTIIKSEDFSKELLRVRLQ